MRVAFRKAVLFGFLIHSLNARAVVVHDYDLEKEIPAVTIIGPQRPEYVEAAQKMRQRLIDNLAYWQKRGLPDPPDLKKIFIFSDPKDLTVLEVLEVINPEALDADNTLSVFEHMKREREALENSQLFKLAEDFRRNTPALRDFISREEMADRVFDHFCMIRYGFAVTGTWKAVNSKIKVSETKPPPNLPFKDNAFYGHFPRVNLSDLLKPAISEKSAAVTEGEKKDEPKPWDIIDTVSFKTLERLIENPTPDFFSRRIVILPRTTEGEAGGDVLDQVSTLLDEGIDSHELGHHINASLAYRHVVHNRLLDELFADYLSFAVSRNPKIGEHFAKASGEIARRLGARETLTAEEAMLKASFERIGKRGYLRDFTKASTIETIDRHEKLGHPLAGSYDGGDPGRAFLWQMNEILNSEERLKFDEVTVEVIRQLGNLPKVVASLNSFGVMIRHFNSMRAEWSVLKEERDKLFASEDPRVEALLDQALIELRADEAEMKKLERFRAEPEKFQKELQRRGRRRALKLVGPGGFNIETEVALAARERLGKMEKEHVAKRGFLEFETPRPATFADYSLAEMFRAYFRAASELAPELVDRILERAGHTMVASPQRLEMDDGLEEIVFVRNPDSPQWAWSQKDLRSRVNKLHDLRPVIERLRADPAIPGKITEEAVSEYDRLLEGLHEFERTNSWFRLKFPNPAAQAARLAFQAGQRVAEEAKTAAEAKKAQEKPADAACAEALTTP